MGHRTITTQQIVGTEPATMPLYISIIDIIHVVKKNKYSLHEGTTYNGDSNNQVNLVLIKWTLISLIVY